MDSESPHDTRAVVDRASKSYSNTVLRDNTHAVFGDVSQDVHINGGLHLHFSTPLQAINVADSIAQFLHVGDQLLHIGRRLERNGTPIRTLLNDWIALSDNLFDISRLLSIEQNRWQVNNSGFRPSATKAFFEFLNSKYNNAKHLHSLIHPFTENMKICLNTVLQDSFSVTDVALNLITMSATGSKSTEFDRSRAKLIHKQIDDVARERLSVTIQSKPSLKLAYSLFIKLWQKEQLDETLSKLSPCRSLLNAQLLNILNDNKSELAKHGYPTLSIQDTASQGTTTCPEFNIVEVLSINHSVKNVLQNSAAIITRQNSETQTLIPQPISKGDTVGQPEMSLIRYSLGEGLAPEENQSSPLIENTRQFINLITSALCYREEGQRLSQVAEAHKKTFSWIFEEGNKAMATQFPEWLRLGNKCFWINGKAGSGKSTLMKYIVQHERLREMLNIWAGERQLILGIFFFWYAGTSLQRSYEGLLRSLLRQVIEKRPDLTPVIFPQITRHLLCSQDNQVEHISLEELQEGVLLLAKNMPSNLALFFMIDGVDEYSGNHFEFAKFIEKLAQHSSIKILVSSRPIPACYQVFSCFPNLRVQDLTANDIRDYIHDHLLKDQLMIDMNSLEPGFAKEVKQALTEKSSGVFLWIVIVVKNLIIGLGNYDDKETLLSRIDDLPNDLEKLYDHMFGRMSTEYQRDGSQILQLVSHARKIQDSPLSAVQLFEAMKGHAKIEVTRAALSYDGKQEALRVKQVAGKLRSRCCGLVEVTQRFWHGKFNEPTVEFLHRTVYDYLQEDQVWTRLKEMNQMSLTSVNLSLLASSVHMLKKRVLFPLRFCTAETYAQEKLSACLSYCDELDGDAEADYLDLLNEADTCYLECCRAVITDSSDVLYAEAYRSYSAHHQYGRYEVSASELFIAEASDLDTCSMYMIAKYGPIKYFEHKVELESWNKSLLLFYLLRSSTEEVSPQLAQRHLEKIEILLKHGASPNACERNCSTHDYNADDWRQRMQVADWCVFPWNFWIRECSVSVRQHLRIALLLIKAGAEFIGVDSTTEEAPALTNFKRKLREQIDFLEGNRILNKVNQTRNVKEVASATTKEDLDMLREILQAVNDSDETPSLKRKASADESIEEQCSMKRIGRR